MIRDKSLRYILFFLLVIGVLLGAYERVWEQGAKKVTVNNVLDNVYLHLIWDASDSMRTRENGIERFSHSQEILSSLVENTPSEINLGLRIFGARRVDDEKDSFLAIPLQENNREGISNFVNNVTPLGQGSITYSLQEAKKDLANLVGHKNILLVTDGIVTDYLPSQQIVNKLIENDIVLHIIQTGNLNNQSLSFALKEIANVTGGKYFSKQDYQDLMPTFKQMIK